MYWICSCCFFFILRSVCETDHVWTVLEVLMMKCVVLQADPAVENPSEVKSEPKPVPVENGLSHTPSAAPKPASQISTQPQSTGQSFTQLTLHHLPPLILSYKPIHPLLIQTCCPQNWWVLLDMHQSYLMRFYPIMIQAQPNQRRRLKIWFRASSPVSNRLLNRRMPFYHLFKRCSANFQRVLMQ